MKANSTQFTEQIKDTSKDAQLFVRQKISNTDDIPGLHANVDINNNLYFFMPKIDKALSESEHRALFYDGNHNLIYLSKLHYKEVTGGTKIPFPHTSQIFAKVNSNEHGGVGPGEGEEATNYLTGGSNGVPLNVGSGNQPQGVSEQDQSELHQQTLAAHSELLSKIANDLTGLKETTLAFGNNVISPNSGAGGALKINVNLNDIIKDSDSSGTSSGFQDTFADSASGTLKIKNLIDSHEAAKKMGNNRLNVNTPFSGLLSGASGSGLNNLGSISGSENNSLESILRNIKNNNNGNQRCPSLNRDNYYSENQLSQCYGCNPDKYLRGEL